MDSPQSVVSPFKTSVVAEAETPRSRLELVTQSLCNKIDINRKEVEGGNEETFIGSLEVYIHQARDIHNICIYHKQDVYAKLCLTSDPEITVSTKIVNGGGRNPVFNDNLQLNVRTVDCSLKCEIWMLSRVKNYLEDQLLGFALVPLSEVIIKNGKLEKEFSLSSTDLFHSPAGFVLLSLSYTGASPEVLAISSPPSAMTTDAPAQGGEDPEPVSFEKIEFPDPKIVNENQMMVSEYFEITASSLDSQDSESLDDLDTTTKEVPEVSVHNKENLSTATVEPPPQVSSHGQAPSTLSTNRVSSPSNPPSSQSSDVSGASHAEQESKYHDEEHMSPLKEKNPVAVDSGNGTSAGATSVPSNPPIEKPIINMAIEQEQKVVQQDIVDMYMKSMQQFTESLAKMKLPMDFENEPTGSGDSTSDQKSPASKNTTPRVFYGSRAFF